MSHHYIFSKRLKMSYFLKLLSQKLKKFQHVITTYNFYISHHYIYTKRLKMSHLTKIITQKFKILKHVIMTYNSHISHHYIFTERLELSHFCKLLSQKFTFFSCNNTTYWPFKSFLAVITPHIDRLSHLNILKKTSYIVPFQTDSIVLKVT